MKKSKRRIIADLLAGVITIALIKFFWPFEPLDYLKVALIMVFVYPWLAWLLNSD